MVIGVLQAKISIPASQSLKDKRSVLKGVKDGRANEVLIYNVFNHRNRERIPQSICFSCFFL